MVQARVPVGCRVPPRETMPGLELTRVAGVTTQKGRISRLYFSIIIISIIITIPPANSRRSNTPLMPSTLSAWTVSNLRWCIKNCRIISKVSSRTLLPRATNWIWCCSLARRTRLRVLRCYISKLRGGTISSRWITRITTVNPSVPNVARYIRIIPIWSNTLSTFIPCKPNTSRATCAASNSRPSSTYRSTCFLCTVSESERATLCIRCRHICKPNNSLLCSLLVRKFPQVNNNSILVRKDGPKKSSDLEIVKKPIIIYTKNSEEIFWRIEESFTKVLRMICDKCRHW